MMLADKPASITLSRQTMAPVSLLRLPRWQYRANICTNRPTTTRCTAPWPCWAKRGRHLDVAERSCQPAAMSFRNRKSARARGLPVHGADRGHHGGQRERHRTLRFAASCTHHQASLPMGGKASKSWSFCWQSSIGSAVTTLGTACMGAASVLTVHVYDSILHSTAARAYGKRRRHHTSAGRLQSMLSGTEFRVAVGYLSLIHI